jgi:hypothetical protein
MTKYYSDLENTRTVQSVLGNVQNNQLVMNSGGNISGYTPISEITDMGTAGISEGQTLKVVSGVVSGYTPTASNMTIGQRLFNSLLGGS